MFLLECIVIICIGKNQPPNRILFWELILLDQPPSSILLDHLHLHLQDLGVSRSPRSSKVGFTRSSRCGERCRVEGGGRSGVVTYNPGT